MGSTGRAAGGRAVGAGGPRSRGPSGRPRPSRLAITIRTVVRGGALHRVSSTSTSSWGLAVAHPGTVLQRWKWTYNDGDDCRTVTTVSEEDTGLVLLRTEAGDRRPPSHPLGVPCPTPPRSARAGCACRPSRSRSCSASGSASSSAGSRCRWARPPAGDPNWLTTTLDTIGVLVRHAAQDDRAAAGLPRDRRVDRQPAAGHQRRSARLADAAVVRHHRRRSRWRSASASGLVFQPGNNSTLSPEARLRGRAPRAAGSTSSTA